MMMNLYTNTLTNTPLLENPLDGSCIEVGSTTNNLQGDCNAGFERDYENGHDGEVAVVEDVLYENNDTSDADTCKPKRKRHRGPRSWKDKWQELYPWASLRKVNGEDRMFCTFCEAHGSTSTRNAFRVEGSCNFQPSALSTHENSSAHKNACLTQRTWAETENIFSCDIQKRTAMENKIQGKVTPVSESVAIANQLACMADMLETAVTRDDFHTFRAELHLMQRSEDARRINAYCAPTDPLVPVPALDGSTPDNLPGGFKGNKVSA